MYEKSVFLTRTREAILHVHQTHLALGIRFRVYRGGVLAQLVRKTYHIYMHSDPNSACTQNTFFVHAAILHVHIWPTHVD